MRKKILNFTVPSSIILDRHQRIQNISVDYPTTVSYATAYGYESYKCADGYDRGTASYSTRVLTGIEVNTSIH